MKKHHNTANVAKQRAETIGSFVLIVICCVFQTQTSVAFVPHRNSPRVFSTHPTNVAWTHIQTGAKERAFLGSKNHQEDSEIGTPIRKFAVDRRRPLFTTPVPRRNKSSLGNIKPMKSIFISFVLGSLALLNATSAVHAASTFSGTISVRSPFHCLSPWQLLQPSLLFMMLAIPQNALSLTVQVSRQLLMWYMMHLHANPLLTKSVTAGLIGVAGDFIAQRLEKVLVRRATSSSHISHMPARHDHSVESKRHQSRYDARRGLSIFVDGLLITGPLMHFSYELFERILPVAGGAGGSSSIAAIAHVLADSIFLDSIFVASKFIVTGLMEGFSLRKLLLPQLKKDYPSTLMASWVTSIGLLPIEFLCFRYLSLSFRVLAVNLIDVVWDAVISFMAHRNRHEQEQSLIEIVEKPTDVPNTDKDDPLIITSTSRTPSTELICTISI